MPYDSFISGQKALPLIYDILFFLLIIPQYEFFLFSITNSFLIIIILSIIVFNFNFNHEFMIILDVILILFFSCISIALRERINSIIIFVIISFLVSGFLLGDQFVEMLSFRFILSNKARWLIISAFTVSSFIIILLYYLITGKKDEKLTKDIRIIFIIYTSFLPAYFITNMLSISSSHKIPVDTIRSLANEGFKKEYLKEFLYEKYYKYIIAFWIISAICSIVKIISFNKSDFLI